jgi:sugar/nucleoside kinase (ribokinase family)
MKILILGGVSFDTIIHLKHLPEPISQTLFGRDYQTIGSTGAGKAMNLTKLGISNTLHATIGNDDEGERIKKFLEEQGVVSVFDIDQYTEKHVNLMDAEGNRISIFTSSTSANPSLDLNRIENLISSHDIIVLNIIPYNKQLIPLIKKHQKPIWTDLHDYDENNSYYKEFVDAADYLFFSSDQKTIIAF